MKRFWAILTVALICMCLLTACEEEDAFDLYTAMNSSMENITSMRANVDAKINMTAADESVNMKMVMDVSEIIHSETDIEMSMLMSIDMGEMGAMDAQMYYLDGWMYQDILGMKLKMPVPIDEAMQLVNSDALNSINFEKDAVKSSEIKEVGGKKQVSFTLDGVMLSTVLEEMSGSMLESLGAVADMDMTFSDVSYTLLLGSDNMPTEQRIVFSMDMSLDGEMVSADFDMNMTGLEYNSISEISYPDDLDDYMEM